MQQTTSGTTVGIVGLGAMGRGVARNLIAKGFPVIGRDVSPEALRWLNAQGGRSMPGMAALAQACEVVVSLVVNDAQTEEMLFGADGLAACMRPSSVLIACSTLPPSYVRQLSVRLSERGIALVDAPVTGGKAGAEAGSLTVMAAGKPEVFERIRPVLAAFGEKVFFLGAEPGMGSQMKVINQLLCGVHIAAAAEALALAKRDGLPLATTLEVLCSGAASSWMLTDRGPRMVSESFTDVTSAVDIFVKDMGLVLDAARQSVFAAPMAHAAYLEFLSASAHGLGRLDDSAVIRNYLNP